MTNVTAAAELQAASRSALRDLLLTLADNKRVLGIRYSDWMLGAPSLESGIAASSMAQDEWGHARLTYALLSDFGDDPKQLEHHRPPDAYHTMEPLDSRFGSWPEVIAAALLIDTALSVQFGALVDSRYAAAHNRVQKLLDEESFHFQYAAGWADRLSSAPTSRAELARAAARMLPIALRWFGHPAAEELETMVSEELVRDGVETLRERYLQRVGPVLERAGIAAEAGIVRNGDGWRHVREIDWAGWNDQRRRAAPGGPDADTVARARGDKNRAMLLE